MSEHEKTTAEALDWDCIFGECEHVDDCPVRVIEVCAGCTVVYEPDEIDALLPWDVAEARGHAPEAGGSGS